MSKKSVRSLQGQWRSMIAIVALTAAILAFDAVSTSESADAYCSGTSTASVKMWFGEEHGRYSNTCRDGDKYYSGRVFDAVTDGFCVSAEFSPHTQSGYGGSSGILWYVQSYSCTTGGSSNYGYQGSWEYSQYTNPNWKWSGNADFRVCQLGYYGRGQCSATFYHGGQQS